MEQDPQETTEIESKASPQWGLFPARRGGVWILRRWQQGVWDVLDPHPFMPLIQRVRL